jgi:acetamidase/formamidase
VPPGRYAGNIAIRDLTEGATLYVPVFVKGALLWTGDSHAAQGNGEINLTALETAYKEMNVTVDVVKNMNLEWPRIETKDAWITLGLDRDLNKALDILTGETSKFLMEQRNIDKVQAEKIMMASWDCRISQVVDVNKGIHCFSAKNMKSARKIEALPDGENKAYFVTVGKDADLNKAMDDAAWAMIDLLQNDKKLTRLDAYSLASMVMDCRLAAPAGAQKAVHCVVPKSTWVASR